MYRKVALQWPACTGIHLKNEIHVVAKVLSNLIIALILVAWIALHLSCNIKNRVKD